MIKFKTNKGFGRITPGLGVAAAMVLLAATDVVEIATAQPGGASGGQPSASQQSTQPRRRPRPPMAIPSHDPADEVLMEGGLVLVDMEIGDGEEMTPGDVGLFDYSGWLAETSSVFATTRTPGREPLVTAVPGRLIEGWNQGIPGMREGGHRKLIVPATMGYGEGGYQRIGVPPNADLIFDVILVKVLRAPVLDEDKVTELEDGALVFDAEAGEGTEFAAGGFGMFHVSSWTSDGAIKGTSYARDEPSVVNGDSTQGWSTYALGMKQGGIRYVDAPMATAVSDEEGTPEVTERQVLVIEAIEITPPIVQTPHEELEPMDFGEGLVAYEIKKGEGRKLPRFAMPHVQFSGWRSDGTVYDTTLAPGETFRVIQPEFDLGFWKSALEGIHIGGKRKVLVPAKFAYGDEGSVELRIGPGENVIVEFEVLAFEMPLFLPPEAELDPETRELMESGEFFNLGGEGEEDSSGGFDIGGGGG